ncbi:FGGY-family carbohydrate kinase [Halothece sp. PCC 7418]|uniref:FGGY-family carbohydrate kinase n=1 Tax=Halothece sp. (strain PCC 7418) TaxID=65093 RepID=UPI0005A180DF|nr:FGGY-family carbohydrate kinase [Halothece sp. PCC 7418]
MKLYLGIDFGTSGARAVVIDESQQIQTQRECSFQGKDNWVKQWREALFFLLAEIPIALRKNLTKIAINGTSATVLLCDRAGNPLTSPLLYNDRAPDSDLEQLQPIAPTNHLVQSASSSLAKLLYWQQQPFFSQAEFFLHQADWLGFLLHGKLGISDYHNALKLGYDVESLCYPQWLKTLSCFGILPQVLAPGTVVAKIKPDLAEKFQLPQDCQVGTGTTDSIAAFIASGAKQPGEAVTSLGSTLVLKLLSETPVQASEYGVYSHRYGNLWLTGGASNTGGAVLRKFFSDEDLKQLSEQIDPTQRTDLNYYPLVQAGERFPINDPNLSPQLSPRPESDVTFLQGLLESMARIEAQGYQKLQDLGATPLHQVYTAGGGAKNPVWQQIREQLLSVPVRVSPYQDAAYGTALLAQSSV